jgi:subtilisin family serine protease
MALLLLLVALAIALIVSPQLVRASDWQAEVDPWVIETASAKGETEFIVFLSEQADLSLAQSLQTTLEKGTYVFETLSATADRTQVPVIATLEQLGAEYKSYWVANMIWVRGDLSDVEAMARRADVAHVYANPSVRLEMPEQAIGPDKAPDAIEWNITKVNADDVWDLGYNGQGAVIGGQDTGYDWDHPALKNQYRGWDGNSANHNYSWHDAIHSGGGSCGPDSSEPCDDHGHGTHTMGTMVGDDGGSNQIGMAPGARWIGCRNMDQGNGTPVTYAECYEWFIAPTDLNDQNPNPAMAPHAINNSWSCPVSEGCVDPEVLLAVVDNVRAAGILTAHSAGNGGSAGCSTINAPAAIYDSSFTVAATSSADLVASFSSRGPVTVDGSGRPKPDIAAPGVSIRSSVPGGGYASGWSGTSMAAPHVAGQAALMISADMSLAGQVDELEEIMEQTAFPLSSTQNCGGIPGNVIPNNIFGHGRIDALTAAEEILLGDFFLPYLTGG